VGHMFVQFRVGAAFHKQVSSGFSLLQSRSRINSSTRIDFPMDDRVSFFNGD
jgi:hypothetical protein